MYTDPDFKPEKPVVLNYLHEYTYPELLTAEEDILDWTGVLWCGRNRRGMNAPNKTDLWLAWQRGVKAASTRTGFVTPHVMDYFQRTKGFMRPPKNGELDLRGEEIHVVAPIETVDNPVAVAPKFTWSPTKIQAFQTCPYQFAANYYYKTLPYVETEAIRWGNRQHKAAEDYFNGVGITDPEAFKMVEKWVRLIERIPGERFVESKISVDSKFQPCEYSEGEGRMIADVYVKNGENLYIFDYKSGKQKDDEFQLRVYSLLLAIKYPDVQKITYKYIWTKDDIATGGDLLRTELVPVAKDLREKIERVRAAWDSETFVAKPSGLCKNYCGATECPHCGRGR